MSQIIKTLTSGGPIPPIIPTTFTADTGSATPAANNLNVFGGSTNANDIDGITTVGSGSTVTIQLTNRYSGTTSTAGGLTATPLIMSLASPGVYLLEASVLGYRSTAPAGGVTYKLLTAVLVDGGIAKIIGAQDKFVRESDGTAGTTDLTAADANMTVTGANNQVSLTVTGVAGSNLNWTYLGTYVQQL